MKIAFIGLGVMGSHMAGHLASVGHDLKVFNRTSAKAKDWSIEHRGEVCTSPQDACADVDVAFCCVGDDADVEDVLLGQNGAFEALKSGSIVVDHTTTSAHLARKIHAQYREKDIGFIDAPVSGGEAGAVNGTLTVMCGGDEDDYLRIEPILKAYTKHVQLLGSSGSGQLAKMVNQVCIAGVIQGLAEALSLGQKSGLSMEAVIEVLSNGAAQSWQMDNRAETMLRGEFEFGFAVNWMRKDLRICMEQAGLLNVDLPITSLVDQFYEDIQRAGGGRWDTSSLIQRQTALSSS